MRVAIVGGGAAGMACASLLKRRRPETEVQVFEAGEHVSYSACGIPDWLGGKVEGGPERLVVVSAERAREERGIDVRTRTRVAGVDPASRTLSLDDGERVGYDRLVLATGVRPLDPFDSRSLANVFAFRHLDDGIRARRFLEEQDPQRACVVGGGFVGIEVSEALVHRGVETTLVQQADTLVGARLCTDLGERIERRMQEAGIDVRTGTRARAIERSKDQARAVALDGDTIATDLVVVAVGTEPRSRLAQQAGCRTGPAGAVIVDERMRTSVEGVLACGDCVAYRHRLTGEHTRQPLALHANRGGRIAGATILDEPARFPGILGTAATQFADLEIALTGLTQREARQAGYEAVSRTIEATTKAGYEPGARPVHVHLVAEQGTGRVLGGQIVGGPGAGKRIDTLAAAIWSEATCRDVEAMDLAYSPGLSPTWDPLAIAARLTAREADPRDGGEPQLEA